MLTAASLFETLEAIPLEKTRDLASAGFVSTPERGAALARAGKAAGKNHLFMVWHGGRNKAVALAKEKGFGGTKAEGALVQAVSAIAVKEYLSEDDFKSIVGPWLLMLDMLR